jgi:glycosyltransferase involved in cell wall biosynthesis
VPATRVSVVIPLYRQAEQIPGLIAEYRAALEALPVEHEIVAVLNGPDDGSADVCKALTEDNPTLRWVSTPEAGWGRAVRLGLAEATGDLLAYTNAARTSGALLATVVGYAVALPGVVVKASRRSRDSFTRRLGSLFYNLECRALFDLPDFDVNGTPKAFSRDHARLLDLRRDDDLIDAEFLAWCRLSGYPIVEVPIVQEQRRSGRSTTKMGSAARMYRGAFALRREIRTRLEGEAGP